MPHLEVLSTLGICDPKYWWTNAFEATFYWAYCITENFLWAGEEVVGTCGR